RLEHATPVLMRNPALAAVTNRLDDGHADVARLLLDGVDHRLDTFADYDSFDFDHVIRGLRRSSRKVSRHRPSRLPIRSRKPASATRRSSGGWAADQSSQDGIAVSNVARPSRIPSQ